MLKADYVIVGAGSAGAVVANRLSADPSVTVCLIEAGQKDTSPKISTPLGVMLLAKDKNRNWLFSSTPQSALKGRTVSIPRGKVLGGSSAINGMIYIRGHRADYDAWAQAGCAGWDYASVLPYFMRSECNSNPDVNEAFHGRNGELSVSDLRSPNPMDTVFADAATQLQFRRCSDFNVPEPEGVGTYQVTQKDGRRHSSAAAFLTPIRARSNLTVLTGCEVEKIDVKDGKATGVVLDRGQGPETVSADVEVILCAGAIGSPDILLRSGIGDGNQIKGFGGEVVVDLPGVGRNLQDHVDVMVINKTHSMTPYGVSVQALPKRALDVLSWVFAKRGMFSSNMVEAGGFVRSSPAEPRPDLQFHIIPGRKSHRGRMIEYGHGVSLHTCILRPESRGQITRSSATGAPDIDLGLLTHEDDLRRLVQGVKLARTILGQQPFAEYGLNEILPGAQVQSDDDLADFVRDNARTVYHPVGTCKMGVGADAVVTPRLQVRGVAGLRVADASIMPTIVSGNTNAPAIMIGEKAADMILEDRLSGAA